MVFSYPPLLSSFIRPSENRKSPPALPAASESVSATAAFKKRLLKDCGSWQAAEDGEIRLPFIPL